jgi:hypothetical protein
MKTSTPTPPKPTSRSADEAAAHASRDPLAHVPPPAGRTDRFTAQLGDIEFVTVGSVEVVTHAADAENAQEE